MTIIIIAVKTIIARISLTIIAECVREENEVFVYLQTEDSLAVYFPIRQHFENLRDLSYTLEF